MINYWLRITDLPIVTKIKSKDRDTAGNQQVADLFEKLLVIIDMLDHGCRKNHIEATARTRWRMEEGIKVTIQRRINALNLATQRTQRVAGGVLKFTDAERSLVDAILPQPLHSFHDKGLLHISAWNFSRHGRRGQPEQFGDGHLVSCPLTIVEHTIPANTLRLLLKP